MYLSILVVREDEDVCVAVFPASGDVASGTCDEHPVQSFVLPFYVL